MPLSWFCLDDLLGDPGAPCGPRGLSILRLSILGLSVLGLDRLLGGRGLGVLGPDHLLQFSFGLDQNKYQVYINIRAIHCNIIE